MRASLFAFLATSAVLVDAAAILPRQVNIPACGARCLARKIEEAGSKREDSLSFESVTDELSSSGLALAPGCGASDYNVRKAPTLTAFRGGSGLQLDS